MRKWVPVLGPLELRGKILRPASDPPQGSFRLGDRSVPVFPVQPSCAPRSPNCEHRRRIPDALARETHQKAAAPICLRNSVMLDGIGNDDLPGLIGDQALWSDVVHRAATAKPV